MSSGTVCCNFLFSRSCSHNNRIKWIIWRLRCESGNALLSRSRPLATDRGKFSAFSWSISFLIAVNYLSPHSALLAQQRTKANINEDILLNELIVPPRNIRTSWNSPTMSVNYFNKHNALLLIFFLLSMWFIVNDGVKGAHESCWWEIPFELSSFALRQKFSEESINLLPDSSSWGCC